MGNHHVSAFFLCKNILVGIKVKKRTDNPIIESLNGWIKEEMKTDFIVFGRYLYSAV